MRILLRDTLLWTLLCEDVTARDAVVLGSVGSVRILEGGGPPFFTQFRNPNIIPILLGVFVKPQDLSSFGGNQPKLLGSDGFRGVC